jgi:hypothetical protein
MERTLMFSSLLFLLRVVSSFCSTGTYCFAGAESLFVAFTNLYVGRRDVCTKGFKSEYFLDKMLDLNTPLTFELVG